MVEFFAEYGLFLAKAITLVVALLVIVMGAISAASSRVRGDEDGHIEVRKLNERLDDMRDTLREASLDPREFKRQLKAEHKAERKAEKARRKKKSLTGSRLCVSGYHLRAEFSR